MNKLLASIKKEAQQLISDGLGLTMMFALPVLLVFIITIVQDSAYKIVNENNIELLVSNKDEGEKGDEFIRMLEDSKMFKVQKANVSERNMIDVLLEKDKLVAIFIDKNFSNTLEQKAMKTSEIMMAEMGLFEKSDSLKISQNTVKLYYDPVLQENYVLSISKMISAQLNLLESELMITSVFSQMDMDAPSSLMGQMEANQTKVENIPAKFTENQVHPNSTQHNVPAWTLFAMFFMVISLGGNIVKERENGSFLRLKTLPTSMAVIFSSKVIVYFFVAILQFILIFSIGKFTFPLLGLPELMMPSNFLALVVVVVLSSLAAVSFALLIGTITKSHVQANGLGAVLVIIFAAIGGIWVPLFVMPDYMQTIGMFSPLYWCLKGFYILFLQGGNWMALLPVISFLVIFIAACQIMTFLKLKIERLI